MSHPEPSPDVLRQWLDNRHEASELKKLAHTAIDAFEQAVASPVASSESLYILTAAATHPRFVVWDVGLLLIASLGESKAEARSCLSDLARSKNLEHRRRSIQYVTDRYPKSFCISLLSGLLADRSAKVRGFAACRIEKTNLRELVPQLESALERESNAEVRFELGYSIAMLCNNYIEYENENGYNLVLRCDQLFPPIHYWPGRIGGELVTRENVLKHGIALAFDEMRRSTSHEATSAVRRPWQF